MEAIKANMMVQLYTKVGAKKYFFLRRIHWNKSVEYEGDYFSEKERTLLWFFYVLVSTILVCVIF